MGESTSSLAGDENPISREIHSGAVSHAIFANSELFLSNKQKSIASEIKKKSQNTSDLFVAALVILHEKTNPVREIMASVALRNLMEKLPENFNFPAEKPLSDLNPKVKELVKSWDAEFDTLGIQINPSIQPPDFHAIFCKFKDDHLINENKQKERNEAIISNLSGSGSTPSVNQLKTAMWIECHKYFSRRVHGKRSKNSDEIHGYVRRIEDFLADALLKKSFEKFDELDAVIESLES